jgi:hypothetical protein
VTIGSVEPMKQLYAEWGDRVQFVDVLVRQGHPGPGVRPYRTFEEKARDAERYKRDEEIPWAVLIDDLEGTVHRQYGLIADPAYLIGIDGRVAFYNYWTHVPTLHKAVQRLIAADGATVVGEHRTPHPLAILTDGWRALRRGLPQSFVDLETAMPGAASGPWLGYQMRSVLAPVALTSHPWPARRKIGAALVLVALGAVAMTAVRRAPTLRTA